jgi:hypothetical protein
MFFDVLAAPGPVRDGREKSLSPDDDGPEEPF